MSVEALARQLAAVAPETLERFLATCDAEEHEAVEAALALLEQEKVDADVERDAADAERWRRDPAHMAHHLTRGRLKLWRYVQLLGEKYRQAVRGESIRQIWNLPARYGKSVFASQWGPTWTLDDDPSRKLILVSYGDTLALENAIAVRSNLREHAAVLRATLTPDRQQAGRFTTTEGGGLLAAGILSTITGFGGHGIVFDDPFKNWQEAHSAARRELIDNTYKSVVTLRLEDEASFILVVQCVAEGQRVAAERGEVPVEQVCPGERVWALAGERMRLRTVTGARLAGVDPTLTIATNRSRLAVNARHPFLVVPPDGHARPKFLPEWKAAGDLQVGDLVVQQAAAHGRGAAPVDGWDSPARAWLLGYMVGDGWVTTWKRRNYDRGRDRTYESKSSAVCCAIGVNPVENERVAEGLTEAFGRRPKATKARYWRLDHNQAARDMEVLGLHAGVGARRKTVPGWVFEARPTTQRAFLEGLLAADGNKVKRSAALRLGTSSEQLAYGAIGLARRCGVRTTGPWREDKTIQAPNSPKPVESTCWRADFVFPEHDLRGQSLVTGTVPVDLRVERVKAIESGPALPVYDLSVDGDENFVAEGFVVHNTRWHEDDQSGRLQKRMEDGTGEAWDVVRIPALAEPYDPASLDPLLRIPDALGRAPGEVIEPERFSLPAVKARALSLGSYLSAGLEQQRPAPEEGNEIKRAWFRIDDNLPPTADEWITSWDMKLKNKEAGDFVVGQTWARTGSSFWLVAQLRGQWNQPTTENAIALAAVREPRCRLHVLENTGNGPEVAAALRTPDADYVVSDEVANLLGMSADERAKVQSLRRAGMAGIRMENVVGGDKSARMRVHSGVIEAGDVHLWAHGSWLGAYLDEVAAFPNGAHDDQVDATSQALKYLRKMGSPATLSRPQGTIGKVPIVSPSGGPATLRIPTGRVAPATRLR